MKNIYKNGILAIVVLITTVLMNFSSFASSPQDDEVAAFEPTMEFKTLKKSDGSRDLIVKLIGEGEESLPVRGAEINFYNLAGEKKIELGKAKTDAKGIATLNIKPEFSFTKDASDKINLKAEFAGTENFTATEADLSVLDLTLTMELSEVDSVKTIHVTANYVNAKGELVPLNEIEFGFYIQGLYSRLKIGDGFLEAGECDFEFPKDLKGDYLGNLEIYAAFLENEDYGDVEVMKTAKWGTHRANYSEPERSLWTSGAPLWMIITLTIMLLGVWSHYLYAVIQLILVKREGKKLKS